MQLGWFSRNGDRRFLGRAFTIAVSLILCANASACSSAATPSPATSVPATPATSVGSAAPSSTAPDLRGQVVTMATLYTGTDADNFLKALKPLTDSTGIVIKFTGTRDLLTYLAVAVDAGTPPDIGITSTPGSIQDWATKIPPLPADIVAAAKANLNSGWIALGSGPDGSLLALPDTAELKGIVWYSPKYFKQYGYTVPTTWDEYTALQDKMAKDGHAPWCVGIESGDASGWVVTDWIENFVLRMYGPDVWDQWVSHKILSSDPRILAAAQAVAAVWSKPGYILQSPSEIVSTAFQDAGLPVLDGKCMMYQLANFYNYYYVQAGATTGPDGDVNAFAIPPMTSQFGNPMEISGNFAIAFDSNPATVAVMRYFASSEYWNTLIGTNTVLSPWKTTDLTNDPVAIDQTFDQIMNAATVVRFDASDAMPSAVTAAAYHEGDVWAAGQETLAQMLANVDKAWPTATSP